MQVKVKCVSKAPTVVGKDEVARFALTFEQVKPDASQDEPERLVSRREDLDGKIVRPAEVSIALVVTERTANRFSVGGTYVLALDEED